MISKELLSIVPGIEILSCKPARQTNIVRYKFNAIGETRDSSINSYELSYLCKKWAYSKNYVGDISQTQEEKDDSIEFKEDVEEVSYSDDFWYALNNGYIDLDAILVENEAKQKLIEAISVVEDFQYLLESQDFFVEI